MLGILGAFCVILLAVYYGCQKSIAGVGFPAHPCREINDGNRQQPPAESGWRVAVISPLAVLAARGEMPDLNDLLVVLVLNIPSPPTGDGMFAVSGMGGPQRRAIGA